MEYAAGACRERLAPWCRREPVGIPWELQRRERRQLERESSGCRSWSKSERERGKRGKSIGFDANWLIAEIMSRVGVQIRGLWWLWVPKNVELIVLWV